MQPAIQSIAPLTGANSYNNLTLSGTSAKTFPAGTTTVNGVLSREGTTTVTLTGTLVYGSGATLQYSGSGAQTTGPEFLTSFIGSGGVIINNAAGVTLGTPSKVLTTGNLILTNGLLNAGTFTITAVNTTRGTGWIYGTVATGNLILSVSTEERKPRISILELHPLIYP